jgi:hypothetical protein
VRRADNLTTFMCRLSRNLGVSTSWNTTGLSRPVMGLLLPCIQEHGPTSQRINYAYYKANPLTKYREKHLIIARRIRGIEIHHVDKSRSFKMLQQVVYIVTTGL